MDWDVERTAFRECVTIGNFGTLFRGQTKGVHLYHGAAPNVSIAMAERQGVGRADLIARPATRAARTTVSP
jgi:hypothetical protein